ncbi:MAG: hypothetical protein AAGD00_07290, partial [Planctomycetota bacterium]
ISKDEHAMLYREPLAVFVLAFLVWEAAAARAARALARILQKTVNLNEFRAMAPEDAIAVIGKTYPRVRERAERLLLALNAIFKREDALTLEPCLTMPKRESRKYLESLEGCPGFVAARVTLLCADGHAIPIDERLAGMLEAAGVAEAGESPERVASFLERQVKSGDGLHAYLALRAWSERGGKVPRGVRSKRSDSAPAAKKKTRRKTSKAT